MGTSINDVLTNFDILISDSIPVTQFKQTFYVQQNTKDDAQ